MRTFPFLFFYPKTLCCIYEILKVAEGRGGVWKKYFKWEGLAKMGLTNVHYNYANQLAMRL